MLDKAPCLTIRRVIWILASDICYSICQLNQQCIYKFWDGNAVYCMLVPATGSSCCEAPGFFHQFVLSDDELNRELQVQIHDKIFHEIMLAIVEVIGLNYSIVFTKNRLKITMWMKKMMVMRMRMSPSSSGLRHIWGCQITIHSRLCWSIPTPSCTLCATNLYCFNLHLLCNILVLHST